MHIVLAAGIGGVALLYFWLIGHWFGRVLAFLLLAVALGSLGAASGGSLSQLTAVDTLAGDGRYHGQPVAVHTCPPTLPAALCNRPHQETPDEFLARTAGNVTHVVQVVPDIYATAFPVVGIIVGAVLAWFVSGIPIYVWRRRLANLV